MVTFVKGKQLGNTYAQGKKVQSLFKNGVQFYSLASQQGVDFISFEADGGDSVPSQDVNSGRTGTENDPFYVYDVATLQKVATGVDDWNYDSYYLQTADIDLVNVSDWEPLGYDVNGDGTIYFNGTYDGNGFTIKNLTINKPTVDNVGLFCYIFSTGCVRNIKLVSCNIIGSSYVGGISSLVGGKSGQPSHYASIIDCSVFGSVHGVNYVGGISGSSGALSNITNCRFDGTVTGVAGGDYNESAGGIVGVSTGATLSCCCVKGNITGDMSVGGIFGRGYTTKVYDSYFIGSVTGDLYVGGIAGLQGAQSNQTSLSNCYAFGYVTGDDQVGGISGKGYYGTLSACFATNIVTGTTNVGGVSGISSINFNAYAINLINGNGIEITEFESKSLKWQQETLGWDYDSIWKWDLGEQRPILFYEALSDSVGCVYGALIADGSTSLTTSTLTLSTNPDIPELSASDILFDAGSTGAEPGVFQRISVGLYTLSLSGIIASGQVSVLIAKLGFAVSPSIRSVDVYYGSQQEIMFTSLTANGDPASASTTLLTLTFDNEVPNLAVEDIVFNNLTVNSTTYNTTTHVPTLNPVISKGALTWIGSGVFTLGITGNIYIGGTVEVGVNKAGVSADTKKVIVHRYLSGGSLVLRATSSDGSRTTVPGPVFKKPLKTFGTWQWWDSSNDAMPSANPPSSSNVTDLYARMKFWELNGITEIYYKIDGDAFVNGNVTVTPAANKVNRLDSLKAFTTCAHKLDMKVFVSLNHVNYINDGNTSTVPGSLPFTKWTDFISRYRAYQSSAAIENKFDGIHFDLEYEESLPNTATANQFVAFLEHVWADRSGIDDISVCAAYWWNGTSVTTKSGSKTWPNAMVGVCDRIMVMSYATTVSGGAVGSGSIIEMVRPWYTAAISAGGNCKILYCAETSVGTGFWGGTGKTAMYTALNQVSTVTGSAGFTPSLTDDNSGIAIDDQSTWVPLKS